MKESWKTRAAEGVAWTTLQSLGVQFASFSIFLILARILDPESFGLVALANVAITFFNLFVNQGLGSAIVQRAKIELAHLDTAFWITVGISILMTGAIILASNPIGSLLGNEQLGPVISALSLILIFNAFSQTQMAILRRSLAFRKLAIRSLIAEPIGGVAGLVLALNGFGVWSLVFRELISAFVRVITLWTVSEWRPGKQVSWRAFQDIFSFSIHMFGSSFLAFATKRVDYFLIGTFLGTHTLGYYSVARRLVKMVSVIMSGNINKVAWPVFSRIQDNLPRLRRAFYETTELINLIAFPTFFALIIMAPTMVPLALGEKWAATVPLVQLLSVLALVRSTLDFMESILVAMGHPGRRLVAQVCLVATNIVAFSLFAQYGLVAVVASLSAVAVLLVPLWAWQIQRTIEPDWKKVFSSYAPPVVATLAMLAAFTLFAKGMPDTLTGRTHAIVSISAGIAVYYFTLQQIYPNSLRELKGLSLQALNAFIPHRRKRS